MFKATGDDLGPKFLKIFGLKKKKKKHPQWLCKPSSPGVICICIYIYLMPLTLGNLYGKLTATVKPELCFCKLSGCHCSCKASFPRAADNPVHLWPPIRIFNGVASKSAGNCTASHSVQVKKSCRRFLC